ncbi:50S ribosomal protein L19e [Candidatus Woesearchaeota archaeon]|nr:50S ribosomal protein L19e [Candidatus Woesearchaeota archaeon]
MKLLRMHRRVSAKLMKCARTRVWLDPEKVEDIKEAITKEDIRDLISEGVIVRLPKRGNSRGRIRHAYQQKAKGRRAGTGSRKGSANARSSKKTEWINTIRKQRALLAALREKGVLDQVLFRELYRKAKGGFFRSRRHILVYLAERGIKQ